MIQMQHGRSATQWLAQSIRQHFKHRAKHPEKASLSQVKDTSLH